MLAAAASREGPASEQEKLGEELANMGLEFHICYLAFNWIFSRVIRASSIVDLQWQTQNLPQD